MLCIANYVLHVGTIRIQQKLRATGLVQNATMT
jgi:hypothetical protein